MDVEAKEAGEDETLVRDEDLDLDLDLVIGEDGSEDGGLTGGSSWM